MPHDLDERLHSLAYRSSAGLAPAALIRARGDQRTRRTRAALAGFATLVVLAGAGTAVALTGDGGPHSLQIANTPTPTATPTLTPTPTYETTPTDSALSGEDLLQIDRIGPVRVGMTLDEARTAAGQPLRQEGDVLGNCVYYSPRSKAPDASFMVIDGIVSRIDVDQGSTATQEGIGIGASEADVKRTYPATTVSKHYYTGGHYLRVLSDDGRHAYLFETDGEKVLRFRSGFPNAVDQVEGCA